jgi:hypothetical protein
LLQLSQRQLRLRHAQASLFVEETCAAVLDVLHNAVALVAVVDQAAHDAILAEAAMFRLKQIMKKRMLRSLASRA